MPQILIFGDSIAYGKMDSRGGWADRLKAFLHEKRLQDPRFRFLVYNLGVDGDATGGVLERFDSEARQRVEREGETIIMFAVGANDAQFIRSKGTPKTSPKKFRNNLERLARLAWKFSQKIIFVGLAPVDEPKTTPIPWDTGKEYKNEFLWEYNKIIGEVCVKNKMIFVDVFGELMKRDYKKMLYDGLHPNSDGHRKIFEAVKEALTKNKIIPS